MIHLVCVKRVLSVALIVSLVAAAEDPSDVRTQVELALPHLRIAAVSPTALSGFYEVKISGRDSVFHVDGEVAHIFAGDMYSVTEDGLVNLTELRREDRRREIFSNLEIGSTIVFPAHGNAKAVLNVFTDVTCPFCQKFHQEVRELNAAGVDIRYLAYPREGPDSDTYDLMVSAWCSENRQAAITRLNRGETIPANTCDNPVWLHWELGQSIGVEGTPTLVTEFGRKISGYVTAADLTTMLGLRGEQ